jgi:hypothetical protein
MWKDTDHFKNKGGKYLFIFCNDVRYASLMHCDRIFEKTKQIFIQWTPISTTNKTDRHNITDILLKVVLNTIILILILRFPWHINKGEQVRDLIVVRLCKPTETVYHF